MAKNFEFERLLQLNYRRYRANYFLQLLSYILTKDPVNFQHNLRIKFMHNSGRTKIAILKDRQKYFAFETTNLQWDFYYIE